MKLIRSWNIIIPLLERRVAAQEEKLLLSAALAKSGERLQALTLLMIHYRAGIEDIESSESPDQLSKENQQVHR